MSIQTPFINHRFKWTRQRCFLLQHNFSIQLTNNQTDIPWSHRLHTSLWSHPESPQGKFLYPDSPIHKLKNNVDAQMCPLVVSKWCVVPALHTLKQWNNALAFSIPTKNIWQFCLPCLISNVNILGFNKFIIQFSNYITSAVILWYGRQPTGINMWQQSHMNKSNVGWACDHRSASHTGFVCEYDINKLVSRLALLPVAIASR